GCVSISRSSAFTPTTGSENVTVTCASAVTVLSGGGLTFTMTGAIVSFTTVSSRRSKPRSLLVGEVLKTCTAMTFVPTARNAETGDTIAVVNGAGSTSWFAAGVVRVIGSVTFSR